MASFGPQVAAAARAAADAGPLPDPSEVRAVLLCGMGGSGVGGDAVAAAARDGGRVPFVVHKSRGVPAFVGPDTFVVAASYSGETEETVDAFRAARACGARGAAVTTGGTLSEEAAAAGWAVVRIPPVVPMPRFALGWLTAAPSALLERMGLLTLDPGWRESIPKLLAARAAECGPEAAGNRAQELARDLEGSLAVVWGTGAASGAAAVRWKSDLNENAKTFALAGALPEAAHNEVVGFGAEGRGGRPEVRRALVCLVEEGGADAAVREVGPDFAWVRDVRTRGADALGRFLDLAMVGGFVSIYLALRRGIDPAPIPAIERLKGDRGS